MTQGRVRLSWPALLAGLVAACGPGRPARRPLAPRYWLTPVLVLEVHNRMGSTFRVDRVGISLDGRAVFARVCERSRQDCDALDGARVLEHGVTEGEHEVAVDLTFRGQGYGVFAYLRGYTFRVRSRHELVAEPGRRLVVRIVPHERGGPSTPLEQRPAVRFEEARSDL